MTFPQQLYRRIAEALPGTTTRTFSRYCGMSEGYYGSICAQNLPISTNALICLAEVLDQIIAVKESFQPRTAMSLRVVQQTIAEEIASRTQNFQIGNVLVRKMIIRAVASVALKRDHQLSMPAVILG